MWRDKDMRWEDDDDYEVGNKEKTKDNDDGCVDVRWKDDDDADAMEKMMIVNETDERRK